jgi:hypothetical protein
MSGHELIAILGRCADFCVRHYGWAPGRIAREFEMGEDFVRLALGCYWCCHPHERERANGEAR